MNTNHSFTGSRNHRKQYLELFESYRLKNNMAFSLKWFGIAVIPDRCCYLDVVVELAYRDEPIELYWLQQSVLPYQTETVCDALEYLFNLYPSMNSKNLGRPIVLKSQLYTLVNNRNKVESQLSDMQTSQRIRLLNIDDQIDDSVGIMKSDDFVNSFRDFSIDESKILERFAEFTSQKYRYLSLCKRVASENFSDNEISILIQNGALTIKSENSWYISTPYLGAFIRAYKAGQRGLLTIIKKTRFKELLLSVSSFCI
ncbi:unnamed protein product [Schistosoma curassoni]|uniref:Inner membrane protein n=1 Tax=Schistosoma curassoni TaxID=6186 RepID=A0A183L5F3_9TREM|nr:unnamed protein product [Schistosoma curassoni]